MNYFAQTRYSACLDHWLNYEKDPQYGRALAPSAAGNRPAGVVFYSYANTNIISGGSPALPNAEFYRAAGEAFGDPVPPPVFPWKARPERGQVHGWLAVEPGPAWLKDGATVLIESDTGGRSVRTVTDGTGFFGAVDLPPDRYRVRVERAGQQIFRTVAQDADAGATVLVNGTAAPLFSVSPERMELRMPCLPAPSWNIVVRRAGLESAPFRLSAAAATPVILGVRQLADGYLEIHASGLGAAHPPARAGQGEFILQPLYAGLTPYLPGRYQVNVQAPQGVMAGELKLQAGEAVSAGFNF